jgi:hypothetical protein
MSNAGYRKTEIVGTSPDGIETAVGNGIGRARKTLRNLDWFEVTEIRGFVGETADDSIDCYQGHDEGRLPRRRLKLRPNNGTGTSRAEVFFCGGSFSSGAAGRWGSRAESVTGRGPRRGPNCEFVRSPPRSGSWPGR